MCIVSMIADDYRRRIPNDYPWWPNIPEKSSNPSITWPLPVSGVPREEFDRLKKEVEEMKELLKKAKKQDEDEGNPDCEMDEKVAFLRRIAEFVGIDLEDVFDKHKETPQESGPKS